MTGVTTLHALQLQASSIRQSMEGMRKHFLASRSTLSDREGSVNGFQIHMLDLQH